MNLFICHGIVLYNVRQSEKKGKRSRRLFLWRAVLSGIHGSKPWLSYQNTSWNTTAKTAFLVKSREELYCSECGSLLCLRDHKRRIWRKEGGETRWLAAVVASCRTIRTRDKTDRMDQ